MYQITKQFVFSASHVLDHLPKGHPCARLHGHNYAVEVVVQSPCLDDRGFAQIDYNELEPFARFLDEHLDHRHLNEAMADRPTAENLARMLYGVARELSPFIVAVRVSETPRTWAEYRP
jgi:6-pyruvoyltetrahydropterin/6-carboxytetrahydropterin synthase